MEGVDGCLKMLHVIPGLVFQCLKAGWGYSAVSDVYRVWSDQELRAKFCMLGAFCHHDTTFLEGHVAVLVLMHLMALGAF